MAPVSGQIDDDDMRIGLLIIQQHFQRAVAAAVVDVNNLPVLVHGVHRGGHPTMELVDENLLVVNRDDNADHAAAQCPNRWAYYDADGVSPSPVIEIEASSAGEKDHLVRYERL